MPHTTEFPTALQLPAAACIILAVHALVLLLLLAAPIAAAQPKSKVVLARDPDAVHGLKVDAQKVRALVTAGITALAGTTNEVDAWKTFVTGDDVVGIKVNTIAAPLHVTRPEVVDAIIAGLQSAGVASTNIIVWDRDARRLRQAGYPNARAVINDTGWDENLVYESNIAGKLIWGDLLFGKEEFLATQSHLPRLLTRTLTKLINVPVVMGHDTCGIAGCLYNVSLGAVDNSRRFEQFGQGCSPFIGEIAAIEAIRSKLALNIADALIASYAGGASFKPQYSWPHAALYFSRDPVAVDALCLELIEQKRAEANIPPVPGAADHVLGAARLGLGQNDRARIELIEVEP